MSKISIIIPVYNVEIYLDKCLQSIINQTFKDIEIICINDGSTDDSLSLLKKYKALDNRIVIIDQKNQGLSGARNSGLKKATSPYIMFVDSDDWLELNACKILYHAITTNDCDLVQAKINLHYNDLHSWQNNDEYYFNNKPSGLYSITPENLLEYYVSAWGKLWKKEIIDKYKINFPLSLNFEDNPFTFEYLVVSQNILVIDDKLYNYLRRPNSIISESQKKNSIIGLDRIKVLFDFYDYLQNYNLLSKYEKSFWVIFESYFWQTLYALHKKKQILAFNLANSFIQDKQIEHLKDKIDYLTYKTLINLKNKKYGKIYTIKPQSFIEKVIKTVFHQKYNRDYKCIRILGFPVYTRQHNISTIKIFILEIRKTKQEIDFSLKLNINLYKIRKK